MNPSFEEKDTCPYYSNGINDSNCKFWSSPSYGSSDYFHICGYCYDCQPEDRYILSVPTALHDFKFAHSGFAFSGIINHTFTSTPSVREYIQGRLKDSLIPANQYIFSMYVSSNSTNAKDYCVDNIGVYFSSSLLFQSNVFRIPVTPYFNNPTGN